MYNENDQHIITNTIIILHWPTFRKEAWQEIKNVMPVKTTVRSRGSLIIHDLGHIFFLSSLRGEKHPVNIWAINISWVLYCSTTPALSEHVSRRLKNNFPFLSYFLLFRKLLFSPLSKSKHILTPCLTPFSFCLHVCALFLLTITVKTHPAWAYQGMYDSEAGHMNYGSLILSQGLTEWWHTADRQWGHSHMVSRWRACLWSSKVHGLRLLGDMKSWYPATNYSWIWKRCSSFLNHF